MNNKKRITSLFVCICMLVTLFSGIGTVQAAKNGVVIDFEQAELKPVSNGYGFNDMTYTQGDGWTVKARKSHEGHSSAIVEGTHGKDSKVLVTKTKATTTGATTHDPTNQVTLIPDNSNRMSSTSQYFEVEFDLMMNGKSNLEFMGAAARGTESGRPMRLLSASNGTSKVAKVDMAKDGTAITLNENKWNHFQFVFQSSDITNANGATDDKHKYWVYVNGALTASGENKFVTDRGGYVSQFFGFDNLDIRMLTDFDNATRETKSSAEMYLDNISIGTYDSFPETTYTKTINFDGVGTISNTTDAIAAYKTNLAFWAETSGTECINQLAFVGGALGKKADDVSIKLYQTADHKDVQRFVLRETGYESNKAPKVNPGEWYMAEFEMAKVGTQSEGGVHAFYNHNMGHDGKGGPVLMKVTEGGSLYVNKTETGVYIDDEWHKYTIAIRAADPDGEGDETKDWIKLYVDNAQVLSEEFSTTTRVNGGAFEDLPAFSGIKQLWFQNFQKGAYDEAAANSSATYFDNITVGNVGKTKKFDIEILDNDDPVITIEGANDGDEFDGDSLPVITAVASDDYGIGKFEYYLDGVLVETAKEDQDTIVATFEDAKGGEHVLKFVCEDIYGLTVTKTIYINFVVNKTLVSYSTDFEKFAGGSFENFSMNTNSHGNFKAVKIDEEHGTSVGIVLPEDVDESNESANWNSNGGNTAWMGIPINDVTTPITADFDFYVENRPAKYNEEYGWQTTHDDFIRFGFRTTKGEINFMRIKHDNIEIAQMNETPVIPYENGKWYHATVYMHADGGVFNLTIKDGEDVLTDISGALNAPVTQIRLFHAYHKQSAGTLAVDNLSLSTTFGMPQFVQPADGLYGGTNEFVVAVTESLFASDINAETLEIYNEFGKVAVDSAVLEGNNIIVTTPSPIYGNMDYTFSLPKTTRFSTGDEVGFIIENTLTTLPSSFEISNCELGTYSFKFDALNTTDNSKNITLVFQTWNNDGQITAVNVVTKEIAKNDAPQNYVIVHGLDVAKDETITAYIWDGLNKPKALSPFAYNN